MPERAPLDAEALLRILLSAPPARALENDFYFAWKLTADRYVATLDDATVARCRPALPNLWHFPNRPAV
jgi:hypothetical protein